MEARVEQLIRATGRRSRGAILAAVRAGDERVLASWAPHGTTATPDDVCEIGSLTKPFTGILLADLVARGEVALDDPLGRHLPDAAATLGDDLAAATLEELATHRSGLPNAPGPMFRRELGILLGVGGASNPWEGVDDRSYRELVRTTKRRIPRRERWIRYSSIGFGLLGDALAARAGTTYDALLRERVLAPLGLASTGVDVPVTLRGTSRRGRPRAELRDPMPAGGALRSSISDLTRWLDACLAPPPGPLGEALAVAARPRLRLNRRSSIGLSWMVLHPADEPTIVWHNGGTYGFRSFGAFVPERQVSVVLLGTTPRDLTQLGHRLVEAAVQAT